MCRLPRPSREMTIDGEVKRLLEQSDTIELKMIYLKMKYPIAKIRVLSQLRLTSENKVFYIGLLQFIKSAIEMNLRHFTISSFLSVVEPLCNTYS